MTTPQILKPTIDSITLESIEVCYLIIIFLRDKKEIHARKLLHLVFSLRNNLYKFSLNHSSTVFRECISEVQQMYEIATKLPEEIMPGIKRGENKIIKFEDTLIYSNSFRHTEAVTRSFEKCMQFGFMVLGALVAENTETEALDAYIIDRANKQLEEIKNLIALTAQEESDYAIKWEDINLGHLGRDVE